MLLIVAGLLRHYEVTWPLLVRDLVAPMEGLGLDVNIVLNTDLTWTCVNGSGRWRTRRCEERRPELAAATGRQLAQSLLPRGAELMDMRDVKGTYMRWIQALDLVQSRGERFDFVVALRPDIFLIDPRTRRRKVFDLREACARRPGLGIVSGHFRRRCFFHDRDWDFMAVLCDGARLELMAQALSGFWQSCEALPAAGGRSPPPLPGSFRPSLNWTSRSWNCLVVASLAGRLDYGTLDDYVLGSFDLSRYGIGPPSPLLLSRSCWQRRE